MAFDSDMFDSTELTAFIPETWTPIVLEQMFAKGVASNFFRNLSEYMVQGADICHVPGVFTYAFSVQTQSTQGTEIISDAPLADDKTINVNTHNYIAIVMGDKDIKQALNNYDLTKIYASKAAGTLRSALETALFGLWSSLTTAVGDTATVLSDAEIRTGIETLDALDFDVLSGDLAFFFHPYTYWIQLGAVAKYYDTSARSPMIGMVGSGVIGAQVSVPAAGLRGQLYGIPVYVSSLVVSGLLTYRNLLCHRDAFGYAIQTQIDPQSPFATGSRVRVQTQYQLRNIGWLTVVDILFGVGCLRPDAGVVLNGSTAFIGS